MKTALAFFAFQALILPLAPQAQSNPVVVSASWLEKRFSKPDVVVLHVFNSRAEYDAGHIPGAIALPFASLTASAGGLSSQIAPIAQLDSLLEAVGVGDQSTVVVYGQPLGAARAFMTLEYLGLRGRVSVLDGGMDVWRESGRAVSLTPHEARRASFTPRIDSSVVADQAWVAANAGRPGIALLDARAPEFYLGYSPGQMPRAGHLPNARNVPFSALTGELNAFRAEAKVRKLFKAAAVAAGDTVVTYCHIGMQASLLYLTARRLGHPARLYDGSFEEWSRRTDLPLVNRAQRP